MNAYTLTRLPSSDDGTFGQITDDTGDILCKTVELPWRDNETDKSCIPVGSYICDLYHSPRHGQVWMLRNVPGRTNCEIHAANTILDLEGCIGVGDSFGQVAGLPAVLNSKATLANLRAILPRSFLLTIQ